MLYHIGELSEQCSLDFLIGGKGFRVFFGQGNLLTCQAALAFIQCKLQRRRKADVAGGGPFKGLSGMRYHAAAVIPISCVLRLIAQIAEHFVACSVAMDSRKTTACGNKVCHRLHECGRTIRMDTAAQGRLMAFRFLRCLNCHIGNIICAIPAVLCGAADGQIFKVRIACEEVRRVCGNRPSPFAVFQPQALYQLQCGIIINFACIQICFIIRIDILVEASGVQCQRVFGDNAAQLDEPCELDCLAEGFRGIFGNGFTGCRNFQKLRLSRFVLFLCRHFSCLFGISVCQTHDTIANQNDGAIESQLILFFGDGFVQLCHVALRFFFNAAEALGKQLIHIVGGHFTDAVAPFGVGIHKARIYADFLCFLGGARQKSILNGFALPVREDIFSDISSLLVRHFIGVLRTARKVIHFIIDPFPRKFGCQNAAFAIFAACADNQLALKNIDAKLITGIIKRLCGTNLRRHAFRSFEGFCPDSCAFIGNGRLGIDIVLTDFLNSGCNAHLIHLALSSLRRKKSVITVIFYLS